MYIIDIKSLKLLVSLILTLLIVPNIVMADGQKSLSSTLEVYTFPQKGQDASQQSQDEAECYNWAVSNSGSDPFNLQKQKVADAELAARDKEQAAKVGQGAGAVGLVKGAAKGAVLGEVIDNESRKGAEIGAAVGLVRNRRKARAARKKASEAAEQKAESTAGATANQMGNFKKAFSVCLEAKNYMVKY